MKHLKFLTACFALLFAISMNAQNTEADTAQEERVSAAAEKYTAEMVEVLGLTDQARIRTVQSLNHNYELTVDKTMQKTNASEEDMKQVLFLLEDNRNKRLQGILTPDQYQEYMVWKRTN